MAHSLYTAITWQPPPGRANIESHVDQKEVDNLTNALKDAFSKMKILKLKLKAADDKQVEFLEESRLFAEVCEKYETQLSKAKADLADHANETSSKTKILEDRCKSLSAFAEQHRIASEKRLAKVKQHEETISKHEEKISELHKSHKEAAALNSHIKTKACTVLKTSSEVLTLAAKSAGEAKPEQMKAWLSEVCSVIDSLAREISDSK